MRAIDKCGASRRAQWRSPRVATEPVTTPQRIGTRLLDEAKDRKEVTIPLPMSRLEQLATLIAEAQASERRIREFQALKARLIGDWDFTHGDLSLQKKMFGDLT